MFDESIFRAVSLISDADALLITTGAGFGVDSGLPDFRGNHGFWKAYPALGRAQIDFHEIANPQAFSDDPTLAWGFYGHRLNLYRSTIPHGGFHILQRWGMTKTHGFFVFTSNVDGQFQMAGIADNHIHECHGSIHHLQCVDKRCGEVWSAEDFHPVVDVESCRLLSDLPSCPMCGALARPNILMFSDWNWVSDRYDGQETMLNSWLKIPKKLVLIELGAGIAIPSVRHFGESLNVPIIRINLRESEGHRADILSIPLGAFEALSLMDTDMGR